MKNKHLNKGDKVNVYSIVLSEPVMNVNELLNWARLERGCEQRSKATAIPILHLQKTPRLPSLIILCRLT